MRAITHCELRQYVMELDYREFNRIFGTLSRTSDYVLVSSGYGDLYDACDRLGQIFIEAGVPARYCAYDTLTYQLTLLGRERLQSDRG